MSSSRLVPLSIRPALLAESCFFCQARCFTASVHRNGTTKLLRPPNWRAEATSNPIVRRGYATQRFDAKRARVDVDKRARVGFYTLSKQQGALKMDANTADSIVADFLHQKSNMEHGSNIQRLAQSAS